MCPHPNLIINDETWWQKNSKATHVIIIVYAWSTIILEMHLCNHCSVTKREGPYSPRLDDRTPDDNTRLQVQHSHTEYTQNFTCENSSCFNYWTYTSESTSSLDCPQTPMTSSCILTLLWRITAAKQLTSTTRRSRNFFGNQQILFYYSSGILPPSFSFLLALLYSLLYSPTLHFPFCSISFLFFLLSACHSYSSCSCWLLLQAFIPPYSRSVPPCRPSHQFLPPSFNQLHQFPWRCAAIPTHSTHQKKQKLHASHARLKSAEKPKRPL